MDPDEIAKPTTAAPETQKKFSAKNHGLSWLPLFFSISFCVFMANSLMFFFICSVFFFGTSMSLVHADRFIYAIFFCRLDILYIVYYKSKPILRLRFFLVPLDFFRCSFYQKCIYFWHCKLGTCITAAAPYQLLLLFFVTAAAVHYTHIMCKIQCFAKHLIRSIPCFSIRFVVVASFFHFSFCRNPFSQCRALCISLSMKCGTFYEILRPFNWTSTIACETETDLNVSQ